MPELVAMAIANDWLELYKHESEIKLRAQSAHHHEKITKPGSAALENGTAACQWEKGGSVLSVAPVGKGHSGCNGGVGRWARHSGCRRVMPVGCEGGHHGCPLGWWMSIEMSCLWNGRAK
jgi:hypothetical protein